MAFLMFTNLPTAQLESNLQQHARMYYFNGAMLITLGIVALLAPMVAATFLDLLIGSLMLLIGLGQAAFSFATKRHWTYYLTAAVATIAGLLMLISPSTGVLALGAIVICFLVIQGVLQTISAFMYSSCRGWMWLLFSGLVSLLLAGIIYQGWPVTASWIIGVMLGINFIVFGLSLIMLTNYVSDN